MTWSREIYTLPLVPFKIPSQNLQLIAIRNPNQEKYFASLIFDIYLSEMIFLSNSLSYTLFPKKQDKVYNGPWDVLFGEH